MQEIEGTKAFTIEYGKKVGQLHCPIDVEYNGRRQRVLAIWDTGASGSCISEELAQIMKMVPEGKGRTMTPNGTSVVNVYTVNLHLPNQVSVIGVRVSDSQIGAQGLGLLVGMDIISMGDLSVSNFDNKTTISFRMPSKKKTDYVAV